MKSKFIISLALMSISLIILNSCSKQESSDTTAPVISLNGSSSVDVVLNTAYSDAGATASDAVSGSVSVSTNNPVNTDSAGTYTVTYTASDAAGNSASATRTVNVIIERSNYLWSAGFNADDSCTTNTTIGAFSWSSTGINAATAADQIVIHQFTGTAANCIATVNGSSLTIASQTVGAFTNVSGTGTMNAKGTTITLDYQATMGTTESYHAILHKL